MVSRMMILYALLPFLLDDYIWGDFLNVKLMGRNAALPQRPRHRFLEEIGRLDTWRANCKICVGD
jgi:hypothetical protein